MYHYYLFKTAWGTAGIVVSEKGIHCLELPSSDRGKVKGRLIKKCPSAVPGNLPPRGLAKKAINAVRNYFDGKEVMFDFPLDLSGLTPFQKRVYRELKKVGYGKTRSYSWLAKRIGSPSSVRAVAGANARNPIPLIIPCHRIIRSNGSLGGFSAPGGMKLKSKMLRLEGNYITTPA